MSLYSNARFFWQWIKRSAKFQPQAPLALVPITNPVTDEEAVTIPAGVQAWSAHYTQLLSGPRSPLDLAYWEVKLGCSAAESPLEINGAFVWREVCEYVSRLPSQKAAGPSGVCVDWIKLAVDSASGLHSFPSAPTSRMGTVLFALLQGIWTQGRVPAALDTALIVSIFKSGDRMDTNNYRGICLVESLLKVVSGIVADRLQRAMEESRSFTTFQGGFRREGEAVAQFANVLEICQRRNAEKKPTFIAFLDLKKAFDMVPHGALLCKLRSVGVYGRALNFFAALYSSPKVCVRDHLTGNHGESIGVSRGVRQGCPSSPVLFNIFINDMFDDRATLKGVLVRIDGGVSHTRVPGFLFADDTTLFAESAVQMQRGLGCVEAWAARNEMTWAPSKSAMMLVGGSATDRAALNNTTFTLHGLTIPVQSEVRYMGLLFNNALLTTPIVAKRVAEAKPAVLAVAGFCSNPLYPLFAKLMLIRAFAVPKCSYGGEIFGMFAPSHVQALDSLVYKTMAGLLQGWAYNPCALVLRRDLQIPSIHSLCAGLRARLFAKFTIVSNTKTFFAGILKSPINNNAFRAVWSSKTSAGLAALAATDVEPECMLAFVRAVVEEEIFAEAVAANTVAAVRYYHQSNFAATRKFLNVYFHRRNPSLDVGIAGLLACRARAIRLAPAAVRANIMPACFETRCPCCLVNVPETVAHLLLHCSAFSAQRTAALLPAITAARKLYAPAAPTDEICVVTLLGGGGGAGSSVRSLGKRWVRGLFSNVASFLSLIKPVRDLCIRAAAFLPALPPVVAAAAAAAVPVVVTSPGPLGMAS
jgi:hypothetical protein